MNMGNIDIDIEPTDENVPPEQSTSSEPKEITISYSQYAMWLKCPHQWRLAYIDKLRPRDSTIHLVFGTAIHHALQEYLKALYTISTIAADSINCMELFESIYAKGVSEIKDITQDVIDEFREDGKAILDYVTSPTVRQKHFPSRKYELLGIELPLEIKLKGGRVVYRGYLDICLKEKSTNRICILDFKTSGFGWNKWQKADRTKLDQLVLYKRFYSKLFNVPMDNIDVEFVILKRKLYEDAKFPQQRIQRFTPVTGKMMVKEVEASFIDFIKDGFTDAGEYNRDKVFIKNPGKGKKNCKYCPFAKTEHCDSKEGYNSMIISLMQNAEK